MKPVVPTSTRRTDLLRCALVVVLLFGACWAADAAAQPPTPSSRGRDLEAEMNALKAQQQRFELQAPGALSRNPDFDAMLAALRSRVEQLESQQPPAADVRPLGAQVAELRRQLEEQRQSAQRLDTRVHSEAALGVVICACVCALWAISSGRRSGYWFLGGLFFNVLALFAVLYYAGQDALSKYDPGPRSDPATSADPGGG